ATSAPPWLRRFGGAIPLRGAPQPAFPPLHLLLAKGFTPQTSVPPERLHRLRVHLLQPPLLHVALKLLPRHGRALLYPVLAQEPDHLQPRGPVAPAPPDTSGSCSRGG